MLGKNPAWRTHNLGRLLFSATAMFSREKLRVVHAGGFATVTEVQMALVQNLDLGGTRLTTLAARASMPKQSMLELVNASESLGFVERRSDPRDRRAKIVRFTSTGLAMLDRVREGVAVAEQRMEAVMGAAFVSEMRERLDAYVAVTRPVAQELKMAEGNTAWRFQSINRVMIAASATFVRDVVRAAHAAGFETITPVLLALLRNLDLEGTRLTEIASRARMTKQAMAELVDRAESLGFVARRPDPEDRRAKTIHFTAAGLRLLDELRLGIAEAERRVAAATGTAFVTELRAQLEAYVQDASDRNARLEVALIERV